MVLAAMHDVLQKLHRNYITREVFYKDHFQNGSRNNTK